MSGLGPALLNSLEMGLLLFVIAVGLNIVFGGADYRAIGCCGDCRRY